MTEEMPPAYPFPDDELLYTSILDDEFTVGEDSWFALARLPEGQRLDEFGERTHRNTHRLTIHSPLRGSTSYLVNRHDAKHIIAAMLNLLADDGADSYNEAKFNPTWYERHLVDGFELNITGGRGE